MSNIKVFVSIELQALSTCQISDCIINE